MMNKILIYNFIIEIEYYAFDFIYIHIYVCVKVNQNFINYKGKQNKDIRYEKQIYFKKTINVSVTCRYSGILYIMTSLA